VKRLVQANVRHCALKARIDILRAPQCAIDPEPIAPEVSPLATFFAPLPRRSKLKTISSVDSQTLPPLTFR
jgi:hypothetical protein